VEKSLQSGTPPSGLTAEEKGAWDQLGYFWNHGLAMFQEMGTRPQTLYGIADSPVGLAAWFLDHDIRSYELITRSFEGKAEGLTRDDVLDNLTLCWLTNTAISSARLYWENKLDYLAPKNVRIPVAVSAFPDEVVTTPRSWAEKAYPNLIYYDRHDKGGHFAAWEQPTALVNDLRAGFKSLR
jgi:pimeloyl-ACP methyl ester carboxylesterase